jgi:hypothetical protein
LCCSITPSPHKIVDCSVNRTLQAAPRSPFSRTLRLTSRPPTCTYARSGSQPLGHPASLFDCQNSFPLNCLMDQLPSGHSGARAGPMFSSRTFSFSIGLLQSLPHSQVRTKIPFAIVIMLLELENLQYRERFHERFVL